ncbi:MULTISPECIES: peptide deformylase [Fischerella]|uniref:Peptide deformylase n=1 Tax=Fischerella muscicola CCMEE 5323 TaxID=2019572 RepID=A0A2N6JXI8_FISMU|nr:MULTISPECIES: peptide deformylase [Fischerella]MBD2432769.1 peptide deformylase [Fischerella sp. FACHB-380]PLZ85179.1 peptide deformylase [Fischerella muscicola CCMEE 5323]
MALLPIIQLGNPILRQKATEVEDIQDETVQTVIDDLMATVAESNGVGIAAPQIAQSYRVMIVASRPNPRYPHAPHMEPTAMINPRIIAHSSTMIKDWEGCLSIPGIRGLVPRYEAIEVEYTDRNGKIQRQLLTNFVARIFQHEYDHFDGIVFLDRLESNLDIVTDHEYQKLIVNKI